MAASAALAAGLFTFAFRYLSFDSFSNDHYQHLARAQQMLMGALPVRDFMESGLPLTAALSAVAQLIFGAGLHAEVIWIALMFGLAASLSLVAAFSVTRLAAFALAGVVVTVVASPVSYSYPKLLAYAVTFVAGWWYATKPNWVRLALLAASVVVGFLFRHDHGLILGMGAAVLVGVLHWPWRTAAIAEAKLVVLGLVLASPYLIWVQVHEGIGTYVGDGLDLSRHEASKAVWIPPSFSVDRSKPFFGPTVAPWGPIINVRWVPGLPDPYLRAREREHGVKRLDRVAPNIWKYEMSRWSVEDLRHLVRDEAVDDTHGIHRSEFRLQTPAPWPIERLLMLVPAPAAGLRPIENGAAMVYYLAWALPCIAAALLWRTWHELTPAARSVVVMAVVVQLLMARSMLRDPLVTRVRDVLAPVAVLLPFVAATLWTMPRPNALRMAARVAAVMVLVAALWGSAAAGSFGVRLEDTRIPDGWAGIEARTAEIRDEFAPPRERTGRLVMPIAEYLGQCTPPASRLFTLTFAPELLFFTGRGFAGGHESLVPGFFASARQNALMLQRLTAEDVPFVIMDTDTEAEIPDAFPRVSAYVRERYREVARFPVAPNKSLIVLADAARLPASVFGAESLPCFVADHARQARSQS
jgi:hypothetical protein